MRIPQFFLGEMAIGRRGHRVRNAQEAARMREWREASVTLPLVVVAFLHVFQCQMAVASAECEREWRCSHSRVLRLRWPLGIVKRVGLSQRSGGGTSFGGR